MRPFLDVLGIRLIARSGLSTRTVRIADKLRFSDITKYSSALDTRHTAQWFTHAHTDGRTTRKHSAVSVHRMSKKVNVAQTRLPSVGFRS